MTLFVESPERTRFLEEAILARRHESIADYGLPDDPNEFTDRMVELLFNLYPSLTIDELLLRPREALKFCDAVRQQTGHVDLPDDVILRPVLNRRKRG